MAAAAARNRADPPLPSEPPGAQAVRLEAPLARPSRGPLRPARLTPVRRRLSRGFLRPAFRLLDLLVLTLALGAASTTGLLGRAELWPCALGGLVTLALLAGLGAYAHAPHERAAALLGRLALAVLAAQLPVAGVSSILDGGAALPALAAWAALSLATLALTHLAARQAVAQWRREGRLTPNVVVVGATDDAARLIQAALQTREVAVLGVFDDRSGRITPSVHGVPVLGDTTALLHHRILPYVDRIVLTVGAAGPARTAELIGRLRVLPNELCLLLDGAAGAERSGALAWLARSTLCVGGARPRGGREFAKRMQDLALGLLLLVPALPVMALVALAVRLDSPGPVLFRQRRHGFNNEEISVWKFRSMRADLADHAGASQVRLNDDRVTRVGRFIRKTSLDELPQIFNVLQGRMALVGPRPHPVGMKTAGEDSARLVAEYAWRHRMKPGITGWAQIHGSRGPVHTAEEVRRRVELDVDYIERQSFWLDLYIIAMTLPRLLGDGEAIR